MLLHIPDLPRRNPAAVVIIAFPCYLFALSVPLDFTPRGLLREDLAGTWGVISLETLLSGAVPRTSHHRSPVGGLRGGGERQRERERVGREIQKHRIHSVNQCKAKTGAIYVMNNEYEHPLIVVIHRDWGLFFVQQNTEKTTCGQRSVTASSNS